MHREEQAALLKQNLEQYKRAAYETHLDSEHFRRHALERGIPLLESRERDFCELLSGD